MTIRRFPLPWSIEELEACFVVADSTGQKLAHVYFEEEPGRRSAAKLLTKDEARRMAVNIVAGLARDGIARGAALRGFETAAGSYLLRGDVDDWLAEKHSEDLRVQRSTLRWAKIAGWAGIAGVIIGVAAIAVAIRLAK